MSTNAQQAQKRVKASYTNEEVAVARAELKANGGNVLQTAKQLNIPRQTLESWAKGEVRNTPEVEQIQHEKEPELSGLLRNASRAFLTHATKPEVIEKMDGLQAMKAAGIAIDKSQLLDGLPTSITASVDRQELSVTLHAALGELESESDDPLEHARCLTPTGPARPQDIVHFQG